eukprot:scaffold3118_cov64-Cylindrotheca_fusiformis.AAC.19
MDGGRNKRKRSESGDPNPVYFVYTSQTKGADIPKGTLTHLRLPEGLLLIEDNVFAHCESLTTVNIPSSVIRIRASAFLNCYSLTSVDLPRGLQEIDFKCFLACEAIETVDVPSTVSRIGFDAFRDCGRLKRVKLPATLKHIEFAVFYGCHRLEYIDIPPTVETIASLAFSGCSSLSHIRIPPSIEFIGRNAFRGCNNLISMEVPEGLTLPSTDYEDLDNYLSSDDDDDYNEGRYCTSGYSSLINVTYQRKAQDLFDMDIVLHNWKFRRIVAGRNSLSLRLMRRFDCSPMNKLSYYQSYYSTEDAMAKLSSLMDDDPLAATSETDEFGMTPLHVLSLSQTPNVSMLTAVINGGYPDHISRSKDLLGSTPIDYLCLNKTPNSTEAIGSLVQAAVVRRLDWVGLELWKSDELRTVDRSFRRRAVGVVYCKLAKYELKEILSLLELHLWKAKIDEVRSKESDDRQSCRFRSGASIVIPNVLPFLEKPCLNDYYVDPDPPRVTSNSGWCGVVASHSIGLYSLPSTS